MRKKYVIIVAGGKGLRMGGEIPKQFLVLNDIPVLMHTIRAFYESDSAINVILVLPANQKEYWQKLCETYNFNIAHSLVSGGETRFHSVKNGLQLVEENAVVAIHDGVRPLITKNIIAETFKQAESGKAVCPVIPLTDSIREKTDSGTKGLNRANYCLVQTPQVFLSELIKEAYTQDYSEKFTDDISVFESYQNENPVILTGSPENIKITTPVDLATAKAILKCRI
jgi:2-C-methyl-D-erythritol 4-phosphate cytidylyltransferase